MGGKEKGGGEDKATPEREREKEGKEGRKKDRGKKGSGENDRRWEEKEEETLARVGAVERDSGAHPRRPTPPPLTLHTDGDTFPEAVHMVVDYAGQGLLVGFPAGHQAVAADDSHRAIGIPDLLELRLTLQSCFPGHHTGWLPIGRGAGGHQDLIIVPLLGSKHCLGALYPVGGLGCGEPETAIGPALLPGQRHRPRRVCTCQALLQVILPILASQPK